MTITKFGAGQMLVMGEMHKTMAQAVKAYERARHQYGDKIVNAQTDDDVIRASAGEDAIAVADAFTDEERHGE